jgi:Ca2+-binding RTX toxin-like protein
VANGSYINWFGDIQDVDETSNFNCGGADSIGKGGVVADRESFTVDITSVPIGATITSVAVTVRDGAAAADADGTYQTFVRINTTTTDSGVNLAATPELFDACSEPKTQAIDVPDVVKSETTTLEIGVVKTPPDGSAIRVGTITGAVTYNQPPGAPALSSPADGSTTVDATPTFDWSDAADPDAGDTLAYNLQVDDDCGFPSPELDETGLAASTFTPGSPLTPGTYCWRARAVDDGNIASAWSGTWTLTIDDPPTALDDAAMVAENDPATTIDVLANDQNADGGPMTIGSVVQPANGTVAVAGDGLSLTYEPDPGYCNGGSPTDDFTYSLSPGGSTATVAVTVTCVSPAPTCDGKPATIVGTPGPSVIRGTSGNDVIVDLDDDNTVRGRGGSDTICTGPGNDEIISGDGADTIIDIGGKNTVQGGAGNDSVRTSDGTDTITAGGGADTIVDTGGDNTVEGGASNDAITTGAGNDTVNAGGGNDNVDAGDGNNTVNGQGGDDTITTGAGDDLIDGGLGFDMCSPGSGDNTVRRCEA